MRLVVVEDLEVILGEVGHGAALLVADHDRDKDPVDVEFKRGGRGLRLTGLLSGETSARRERETEEGKGRTQPYDSLHFESPFGCEASIHTHVEAIIRRGRGGGDRL